MAPCDLDCANLQCFLVDPEMDLAPDAPFGSSMARSRRSIARLLKDVAFVVVFLQDAPEPVLDSFDKFMDGRTG